jgi:cytochrome c5
MRYATLLLALSAITLFGCGKSDETSAPVAPPPAEEAPQAESAPITTPEPAPAAGATAIPGAAPSAPAAAPAQTAPAQPAPAAGPAAETAQPDLARGEQTYRRACAFCHDKGVAGAPKIGDTAAWAPRLAMGMDALYASSLRGKGAMPAKGGNPALADADVRAAVDYLVAQSR